MLQVHDTGTPRKVWLAAALAAGTSVVLLGEPLSALDAATAFIVASHESLGAAAERAARLDLV